MCEEFRELDDWKEGEIFICKICARIMERMNVFLKKRKIKINEKDKLTLFDRLRNDKGYIRQIKEELKKLS
jgi:hypothetical protein